MLESRNPFRYSEPVPADELLDRDEEARELLDRRMSGSPWNFGGDPHLTITP